MRDKDLTRDEMLVRLVSKLVFLLRERSSRVLASGAFCCEARLRLTVEMVRLVAVFRDSLDRDPTCCGVPFGIGYGCYLIFRRIYCYNSERATRKRLCKFRSPSEVGQLYFGLQGVLDLFELHGQLISW